MTPGPAVEIDGTFNARDVGGHTCADGNVMRTGVLFRSASLDSITEAGRATLTELGIRTIADLRAKPEIERHGRFEPRDSGIAWHHLDSKFGPPTIDPDTMRAVLQGDDPMAGIYLRMIDQGAPMFRDGLRMIAGDAEVPMLIHCTSGKDRTGLMSAMVQLLCGVPFDTVLADFQRSAISSAQVHADMASRFPEMGMVGRAKLERMSGAEPEWVIGAFDSLGGIDALPAWLESIGVTPDHQTAIRTRML